MERLHPKHDTPAAGWAKSPTATTQGLIAEPQQVNPSLAEHEPRAAKRRFPPSSTTPMLPPIPSQGAITCTNENNVRHNQALAP